MCEANQNQTLPGTAPDPSIPCGAGINVDRDKETLGYARERAADAQACYTRAQAIHVPSIVRDLRQRRDELLHQRARIDEKLYTLNAVLGVFEG